MEILASSEEMRESDRYAIGTLKIPGTVLMENAGRGVAEIIERRFGAVQNKSFIVVCGKGNNGGDGFVAARHLLTRGAKVSVIHLAAPSAYKSDAKINFAILNSLKRRSSQNLTIIHANTPSVLSNLPVHDFIIDAIFGTGFAGLIEGFHEKVIRWINRRSEIVIAIDVPSGLNTDSGFCTGSCVEADLTVTMCLKKIGLISGSAASHVGELQVTDIGYSSEVLPQRFSTFLIEPADVRRALPYRPFNAHKHSVGKIFVLAGSRGLTGAAAMASISALRAGAGAVVLGTPESVYPILAKKLTEVMVTPLWETSAGSVSEIALDQMKKHLEWADAVVVGPGLSTNTDTKGLVHLLMETVTKPILLDADGLNAFAGESAILKRHRTRNLIITPHAGELSRITGIDSAEIESQRVNVSREVAKVLGLTLVLKGARTVTATREGIVYLNSSGNPGMATAGSGDILSGIIASFRAQGMKDTEAAYSGVYLHGLSGDIARTKLSERSILAMDLYQYLPDALRMLEDTE